MKRPRSGEAPQRQPTTSASLTPSLFPQLDGGTRGRRRRRQHGVSILGSLLGLTAAEERERESGFCHSSSLRSFTRVVNVSCSGRSPSPPPPGSRRRRRCRRRCTLTATFLCRLPPPFPRPEQVASSVAAAFLSLKTNFRLASLCLRYRKKREERAAGGALSLSSSSSIRMCACWECWEGKASPRTQLLHFSLSSLSPPRYHSMIAAARPM